MVFIYIEQMILVCSPKLANNRFFNGVFALLLLGGVNGLVIFCFAAMYMDTVWWYNPIELFNLLTYVLFFQTTFFYFIFCLFGSCCCCAVCLRRSKGNASRSPFGPQPVHFRRDGSTLSRCGPSSPMPCCPL